MSPNCSKGMVIRQNLSRLGVSHAGRPCSGACVVGNRSRVDDSDGPARDRGRSQIVQPGTTIRDPSGCVLSRRPCLAAVRSGYLSYRCWNRRAAVDENMVARRGAIIGEGASASSVPPKSSTNDQLLPYAYSESGTGRREGRPNSSAWHRTAPPSLILEGRLSLSGGACRSADRCLHLRDCTRGRRNISSRIRMEGRPRRIYGGPRYQERRSQYHPHPAGWKPGAGPRRDCRESKNGPLLSRDGRARGGGGRETEALGGRVPG